MILVVNAITMGGVHESTSASESIPMDVKFATCSPFAGIAAAMSAVTAIMPVPALSLALTSVVAVTALAPDATAGWSLTTDVSTPDYPSPDWDSCISSWAQALAISNGPTAIGSGYAWDNTIFCDVRVQKIATGVLLRGWTYTPVEGEPLEGWARVTGEVTASGEVRLRTSNSAAAAIGYALVESNMFSQVTAKLTKSAAETSSSGLGLVQLAIPGLGSATIPVTVSTGTGTYPDSDNDANVGEGCVNFLKLKYQSRAEMELFADEGVFYQAYCSGEMDAMATASIIMIACPH